MVYRICFFVFFFGLAPILSFSETQRDSLLRILPELKSYSDSIQTLRLVSKLYRESNGEKALEYAKLSIERAKKANDFLTLGQLYEIYGVTLFVHGDYSTAIKYYTKALQVLENKTDLRSLAHKHHILGYKANFEPLPDSVLFKRQDFHFRKSLMYFQKLKDHEGISYSYYALGGSYQHHANTYTSAFAYGPKMANLKQQLVEQTKDSLLRQSMYFFTKSSVHARLGRMYDREAAGYALLSKVLMQLKDTVNGYMYLQKAWDLHKNEESLIGMGRCQLMYADIYLGKGQLKKALEKKLLGYEYFKNANYNFETSIILKEISNLYSQMKRYKEALKYQSLAWEYQEKNYNGLALNATMETINSYENQLKASKIKRLEAEKRLVSKEKEQQSQIAFGSTIVLATFIISGFILYRYKEAALKAARQSVSLSTMLNNSLEQKIKEAELVALKAQMNPHFIFNSLSSVQSLIARNKQEEAITYLQDFSQLTRKTLEHSDRKRIPLSEEIEFLKSYINLEKLRYPQQIQITWHISDELDLDMEEIPPMIIQPYIENAFKHGLANKKTEAQLHIAFYLSPSEDLICEIEDNGIGRKLANELNQHSHKKHRSMAMSITADRLDLYQKETLDGQNFTVDIKDLHSTDNLATGTKVILTFDFAKSKTT